jgi:hypothetical protein
MSGPRRYDDDEVAEIFRRATREGRGEGGGRALPSQDGMTLSELEEIGAEVGISREDVVRAAHSLERRVEAEPPARFLGAPRSVSRTLHIDRGLTDEEWGRLVADLRRTFDAKGKVEVDGLLRSWTNSNLQVHVEPDGEGYAVRMRTKKGQTSQLALMGGVFAGVGLMSAFGLLLGSGDDSVFRALAFLMVGVGMVAWARASLPAWARTRAEQMEGLAERIPRLMGE